MENRHQPYDLAQMQSLSLQSKINMSKHRIKAWYEHFDGQVYVSFSGGKDSTVLLHLVRSMYPDVKAMFINTGLEYPEIVEFVNTFENVDIVKPKMNFKQVLEKYGYPIFSKETANFVRYARKNVKEGKITNRVKSIKGELMDRDGVTPSLYNKPRYKFMLDADFEISEQCCDITKKEPVKRYNKETGMKAFTAMMACESRNRKQGWIKTGCNAFDLPQPISSPMAFWTEDDVLEYIKQYNIPIAKVYGEVVENDPDLKCKYKTTGLDRSGCMFCLFGIAQQKSPNRLELMKQTHPKQYEWIMKPTSEGGLGYKQIIDWINDNGNFDIKY